MEKSEGSQLKGVVKLWKRIFNRINPEIILLTFGAGLTRLIGLGSPNTTVFDEIHFLQHFPTYYFNHAYYFDIHPPLGKLLIASWMQLMHVNPGSVEYGTPAVMRLFIAIFGVAIVPLSYAILIRLTNSRKTATLGAFMIMLNGVLIVESRFVLIDNLLIFFGLGAIYAAIRWYKCQEFLWALLVGVSAGAAISIKWTGLTMLILALLIVTAGSRQHKVKWQKTVTHSALIIVTVIAVYLSSFWVHFTLLKMSGTGDDFMSQTFQSTLVGNQYYKPKSTMPFLAKTIELNREMYRANATLKATHPYSSRWYTWPAQSRPVYLWEGVAETNDNQANIYLISNPILWWLTSLGVISALIVIVLPKLRIIYKDKLKVLYLLLIAYFINWLPFAKIGRVMFLYHYLFSVIFATMILAVLVGCLDYIKPKTKQLQYKVIGALVVITLFGYLFYSPLNYGWSLSRQQFRERLFLKSWRS